MAGYKPTPQRPPAAAIVPTPVCQCSLEGSCCSGVPYPLPVGQLGVAFRPLPRRALLAEPRPAAHLAGLLVVLPRTQLLLHPAPLDQLLETAEGRGDLLLVMHTHS